MPADYDRMLILLDSYAPNKESDARKFVDPEPVLSILRFTGLKGT